MIKCKYESTKKMSTIGPLNVCIHPFGIPIIIAIIKYQYH